MSLKKALLAVTVLALPVTAQAQPVSGFYVGAGAGINWLMESDVDLSNQFAAPRSGNAEFDLGWGGVISLGYGFGNGVRAEIEGNYRQNDVDSVSGFGGVTGGAGTVRSYGVMANALYDFDLGLPVMPYVGLGAGYVWTDADRARGNTGAVVDGSDGQFAYQAILGAALPLNDVAPGLALTAEYRFMGTLNPEIEATAGATRGNAELTNMNHSLFLGVRYAFGAAPPPPVVAPAPAAAPAPARTFLVFFDWNRADLTDRAKQIIAEAAQNSTR
ncbi:MAG TPA: porin family protein, partial [Falsiroseomonas sp.]|nr:porin family protein [Falsiroseomonas sp.]